MTELRPSEIYFTQRWINFHFRKNTPHAGYKIGRTLDDLCEGRCSVEDIQQICVMWENGKWWTADNRRLWVFRQFERLGGCTHIPVTRVYYIPWEKKSTENGGTDVVIRSNNTGGVWRTKQDGALRNKPSTPVRTEWNTGTPISSPNKTYNSALSFPLVTGDNFDRLTGILNQLSLAPVPVRAPSKSYREFSPTELKFTTPKDQLDRDCPGTIRELTEQLRRGTVSADSVEAVIVYHVYDDYWVVEGNKRLWAFQKAAIFHPYLRIRASVKTDTVEFRRKVRENNHRPLSLMDIITMGE